MTKRLVASGTGQGRCAMSVLGAASYLHQVSEGRKSLRLKMPLPLTKARCATAAHNVQTVVACRQHNLMLRRNTKAELLTESI